MRQATDLSVVIPAYMEEENLRHLLPRLGAVLDGMKIRSEVLIVDTVLPMDNTRAVCDQNRAMHLPRRGGNTYGDAVRTGIHEARGEKILFMDADGSHSPEWIPALYEKAQDHDIVIASRYVEGGQTDNPRVLIWMSQVLNFIYTLVLSIRCKDASNSFKIYRAGVLKTMVLRCSHFDIVEEILVRYMLKQKDASIHEVPFTFKQRMFGKTKRNLVAFVFSFCATLIRLFLIKVLG